MSLRLGFVSKSVESAQRRIEGNNFDLRKNLLQYDDVVNQQREYIYERRNEILDSESIHDVVLETFKNFISNLVESHIAPEGYLTENDFSEIIEYTNEHLLKKKLALKDLEGKSVEETIDFIYEKVVKEYDEKLEKLPQEITNEFEKAIMLRVIDTRWTNHISTMSNLREGIGLRGYSENPLRAYTVEGFELYEGLLNAIDNEVTLFLLNAEIRQNVERKQVIKGEAVNDSTKLKKAQPKKSTKIGRNDPCPCGSGRKFKQCCGK